MYTIQQVANQLNIPLQNFDFMPRRVFFHILKETLRIHGYLTTLI